MIHLHQTREEVFQNTFKFQERIKKIYDRKAKADKFQLDDVVLKWDARNEEKGKHSKFENLWKVPFNIATYHGQNVAILKGNIVQEGWSMVGYSSGTIFEKFSAVYIDTVYTILCQFHCKSVL